MGASPFTTVAHGATAEQAFNSAVDEACVESGTGGYTGTIAEKTDYVLIPLPKNAEPFKEANRLINIDDPQISDKWGPAGAFPLDKDRWLFFGWASE